MEQRKRDFSLDFLKAFAIFLVCQIHYMHYTSAPFDNFISILSCMGVPLFFMVNGALLMNRELEVKKHYCKTVRIFYMSVIWKIISVVVMAFIWRKNIFENGWSELLNYFIGKNTLDGYELGHFWYLCALIGIYMVFPLFKICNDTTKGHMVIKYMIGSMFFFSFMVQALNFLIQVLCFYTNRVTTFSWNWITSYYIFGMYGYCVEWFLVGGILYPKIVELRKERIASKEIKISYLIFGIGWLLLFLMNRFQNIVGEANGIVIDGYNCIPTFMMCTAIFVWSGLYLYKKSSRVLSYISKNTWGIYMLHLLVGTVFLFVQRKYGFPCGVLLNFIKSIWIIVASILLISILKRIPGVRRLFIF